jgi:hypothetical protein
LLREKPDRRGTSHFAAFGANLPEHPRPSALLQRTIRGATRFHHGPALKNRISAYISAIPPDAGMPYAAEHNTSAGAMARAFTSAIAAKVGAAASCSHPTAREAHRALPTPFGFRRRAWMLVAVVVMPSLRLLHPPAYSSRLRHQKPPASLRPRGARSSH